VRRRDFLLNTGAVGAGLLTGSPALPVEAKDHDPAAPSPTPAATGAVHVLEALWKAIQDHCPMLEYAGSRGDEWLEEFRPRVAAAPDLAAAYPMMDELVCRLRDYHTRLFYPGRPERKSLPLLGHVIPATGRTLVVVRKSIAPGIRPGE